MSWLWGVEADVDDGAVLGLYSVEAEGEPRVVAAVEADAFATVDDTEEWRVIVPALRCALCGRRLRSDETRYQVTRVDAQHTSGHGAAVLWYCGDCWRGVAQATLEMRRQKLARMAADPLYSRPKAVR